MPQIFKGVNTNGILCSIVSVREEVYSYVVLSCSLRFGNYTDERRSWRGFCTRVIQFNWLCFIFSSSL